MKYYRIEILTWFLFHISHEIKLEMASHVMQYVYISLNGERFPFAYFRTSTASATVESQTFYTAVQFLLEGGFRIFFGLFDGATPNRSFFNSQFYGKSAIQSKFRTTNKATGDPLILIMVCRFSIFLL